MAHVAWSADRSWCATSAERASGQEWAAFIVRPGRAASAA